MEIVVTLILVGAALLALETVLPGMIAGILGMICLIAGVILGYVNFGMRTGNLISAGVGFGLAIGALCWVKYFPNSRMAQVFVSQKIIGGLGVEKPELLNQTGIPCVCLHTFCNESQQSLWLQVFRFLRDSASSCPSVRWRLKLFHDG
jgi:hypothetical protein